MPKRILEGLALKDSLNNTVVVSVESKKQHKRYKKMVRSKKKYLAHDENNAIKSGSLVKIQEHTPFSKRKKWLVIE